MAGISGQMSSDDPVPVRTSSEKVDVKCKGRAEGERATCWF